MGIDLRHYLPALSAGGTKTPVPDPAADLRQAKAGAESAARLGAGVCLLQSALAGGAGGLAAFAKARQALGPDGALGPVLDELQALGQAQEEARLLRETRTSAFAALKQIARLPLPLPQKTVLGRSVVTRALAGGAIEAEEQSAVEASLLSESLLQETRQALSGTAEPGAAKTLVDEAKQQGLLVPHDEALLDRLAAERAPVEVHRHQARLAWKEQDDLAAYARGELPEPLSEASFTTIHGARGALGAWTRYQAARHEAEALATIRGKSAAEIDAAEAEWPGDPAVFASALAKDAADRRRDPVGYLLVHAAGLQQALDEIESPGERNALLWSAQDDLGLGEGERSPWTLAEEERLADAWDALPSGYGGRNEKLGFLEKHLLSLPAGQRPAAIARLVRQGIVDGTEAEFSQLVADVEAGRINVARRRAAGLGARSAAATPKDPLSRTDSLREKPDLDVEFRSSGGPSTLLTPANHVLRRWPTVFPWGPTAEETTRALQQLWDGLGQLLTIPRPAPPESVAPSVESSSPDAPEPPPPPESERNLYTHPDARAAVDALARHGLTATEAEAVISEMVEIAGDSSAVDLAAFARNYATLQPIGSSDPAVRSDAAEAVAESFRNLQAHDGRMTLAELSLLDSSPDYAKFSGRGAAWLDRDTVVIGDAVVTADGEQLVVETADGLFFAWREGSGPNARYIVDDALSPDDLIALQSRETDKGKVGTTSPGAAAGAPGEDPDGDPQAPKRRTRNYLGLDRKTGKPRYTGITDNLVRRAAEWLRARGYRLREVGNLRPLPRLYARAVEQALIVRYGMSRLGGQLDNKINSISPHSATYRRLLALGLKLLDRAGYEFPE